MQVASPVRFGSSILAPRTLFCSSRTLHRRGGGSFGGGSIAAANTHKPVVYFAIATIGFTSVASLTQQLDIRRAAATATRKGSDVIELQALNASAALAHTAIARVHESFSAF